MSGHADTIRSADQLAQLFHEAYERLAPDYGYKTRNESAVPWEDVPDPNKRLMIAVVQVVLDALLAENQRYEKALKEARWLIGESKPRTAVLMIETALAGDTE